ncbi:MAG: cysteine desulfurase [Candidatus Methanomethylophilaceae archaeon]|nr:cysteine desulfurase [Candidatus Methanomethylophilaceae archaeon]
MVSDSVRNDFPTLRKGTGIYLDSACQSLKPDSVIAAMVDYYENYPACGGRSVHSMASKVSIAMDETREALAHFFGTDDPMCYAFMKNCTEGLNTAAYGLGLRKGDAVVTTDTEHNSNHVPWLNLQRSVGIVRRMSRSSPDGEFDIESFKGCMDRSVKAVSVQHASNVTGCTVPVRDVAEIAHDYGATVIVDGAQAAPHMPVDLKRLGADIYCFSIHKMLGPTGMGVMYGSEETLGRLRPLEVGGGTVGLATYSDFTMAPYPDRFEAGLGNYAGIIGTKAAIDYLSRIGMDEIMKWDSKLMARIMGNLEDVRNLRLVGPSDPSKRGSVFSFNINGLSPHDIAMMADSMAGVMIRSGMHCAHPFYSSRGIKGSARASTYLYNSEKEIDVFTDALREIAETFGDRISRW